MPTRPVLLPRSAGKWIAAQLDSALQALPAYVNKIFARADGGCYCWEAVEAYRQARCQFVIRHAQDAATG